MYPDLYMKLLEEETFGTLCFAMPPPPTGAENLLPMDCARDRRRAAPGPCPLGGILTIVILLLLLILTSYSYYY